MNDTVGKRKAGWSEAEISGRLGISSAVFRDCSFGPRQISAIKEAGIRHIEISRMNGPDQTFDYQNTGQVSQIVGECRKLKVKISSFHLPLHPPLPLHSEDKSERQKAIDTVMGMADILMEMGGTILVDHFSSDGQSRNSIEELLHRLQDVPVILAAENVERTPIRDILSLVDEFGSDQFKMVLDIGHERDGDGVNPFTVRESARGAVRQCRNRLYHLHLHETFPIHENPDHRPPLHPDGIIKWEEIFWGLKQLDYKGLFLFEDGRGEEPEEWIRMTGSFPREFVTRYES